MNLRLSFFFKEKLVALEKIGAATFVTKMEIIEVINKGKILPCTSFSLSGKACDNLPMQAFPAPVKLSFFHSSLAIDN
jgi:hypothetical protein